MFHQYKTIHHHAHGPADDSADIELEYLSEYPEIIEKVEQIASCPEVVMERLEAALAGYNLEPEKLVRDYDGKYVADKLYCEEGNVSLYLGNVGLKQADIIGYLIPFLEKNPDIAKLNIIYNNLDDEAIETLTTNTTLKTLDISLNNVTDKGAVALSKHTSLTKIIALDTQIGQQGLMELEKNGKEIQLSVRANLKPT